MDVPACRTDASKPGGGRMPKIIVNAREDILRTAADCLFENGYGGLAIRDVAVRCGMAAGTLYNYFPSKLDLVSHIILREWMECLERLDAALSVAMDCNTGLRCVFEALTLFCNRFRPVWEESRLSPEALSGRSQGDNHRAQLHQQLSERLRNLFLRQERPELAEGFLADFLVRNLLHFSMEPDFDYDVIAPLLHRLTQKEDA